MLKQYGTGHINAKTVEHPGPCSVLGAGQYSRTGVRGVGSVGVVPISDFIRLAGMPQSYS